MFLGMFVANAQPFEEPATAFETGFTYFRVLDHPPLTSDEFDDKYPDPTMWTSYNPDAANMKVEEDKGALNVYYPEGNQHQMWHKPAASTPDSDGWNYAYRINQNLRSSSEEYKVEVQFDVLPEAGQRY
mmetsp:Transcript_7481/g.13748  ORF Transcript_7481/g.13748 Transcript_7481/m.13748 type:complete len:129 (-) Transcript_7481:207-593(-)